MASTIHEFVTVMISDSIKTQLAAIKENSNKPTQRLIQNIKHLGSRQVKLDGLDRRRASDSQFLIKGSYYPGIVIELAYSQSFKSLRGKAQDLIVNSYGSIQLVIGLETESKKSYKISAWRADFTRSENKDAVRMKAVIEQDVIRDSDGKLKSGSMTFQLQDFGRNLATSYPNADLTKVITLHYNELADYLAEAQECDVQPPSIPNMIRWMEPPPPAEALIPEDEKKFRDLKRKSSAHSEALDSDY